MTVVGSSISRVEDKQLLLGEGKFAADFQDDRQLVMRIVRSPVASGRITNLDVAEAEKMPGVAGVFVGADIAGIPPIAFRMEPLDGLTPFQQPVLAKDRVRYVGEPLAAVFAADEYLAEDAADSIFVDIEELPASLDAVTGEMSSVHDYHSDSLTIEAEYGDIDEAFRSADRIVEVEVYVGRHSGVPLETRGAFAVYDEVDGILHLYGAAKVPHYNRSAIARMLGLEPEHLVLHEGHVGGGFGVRGELYPEDVLVCLACYRFRRAVKWVEDRREHLLAANQSRDQLHRMKAAVAADGLVLGLVDEFWQDQGAYLRTHSVVVPRMTSAMLPGPYVLPAYRATGHVVLTNKAPAGTYRSPGRYEGTFARERLMDAIASEMHMDPIELRKRNFISPEDMPFDRGTVAAGTEIVYDSGDYPRIIDRVLDHLSYDRLRTELDARREKGEMTGLGVAFFVEKSGLGPSDFVRIFLNESGRVSVITGAASIGQGIETVMSQICADAIGVEVRDIEVIHGQTDRLEAGMGAFASRVTVMTGSATWLAGRTLREKLLAASGFMLDVSPETLDIVDSTVVRSDSREPLFTLADLANTLSNNERFDELTAEGYFASTHMNYPYGVHAVVVNVDPEAGLVKVERYVIAYDVGRAVNPMLIEGQLVGGCAQGLGGALYEEFVFDDYGQPSTSSFMDYLLPTCVEVPPIEILLSEDAPSPLNPLGVKGAGEGGTTGVGAAIAAAIDDALGRPGAITKIPATPERIKSVIGQVPVRKSDAEELLPKEVV
jgi:aerobic carbon-monoxide dehydrogenase large subunit